MPTLDGNPECVMWGDASNNKNVCNKNRVRTMRTMRTMPKINKQMLCLFTSSFSCKFIRSEPPAIAANAQLRVQVEIGRLVIPHTVCMSYYITSAQITCHMLICRQQSQTTNQNHRYRHNHSQPSTELACIRLTATGVYALVSTHVFCGNMAEAQSATDLESATVRSGNHSIPPSDRAANVSGDTFSHQRADPDDINGHTQGEKRTLTTEVAM